MKKPSLDWSWICIVWSIVYYTILYYMLLSFWSCHNLRTTNKTLELQYHNTIVVYYILHFSCLSFVFLSSLFFFFGKLKLQYKSNSFFIRKKWGWPFFLNLKPLLNLSIPMNYRSHVGSSIPFSAFTVLR